MTRYILNRYVQAAVRILIGGIFFYAGSISIRSPEDFADRIAGYQILPAAAINPLALALPPLEMMVGAMLIVGWPRRAAMFSALVLTSVFAIALTSAIARGLVIDCGCFGHGAASRTGMWLSLGRDALLGGFLALLYRCELRKAAPLMGFSPWQAGGKKVEVCSKER